MPVFRGKVASMNERNPQCVIFGAGEHYNTSPRVPEGTLVIAADAGYDYANSLGITPDIIVGDFDSIQNRPSRGENTIALPAEKDDPDLLSALKVGWERGAREFRLYGCLGGRIDHTIANIQLLALLAQHGGIGYLYGDNTVVTAITDGEIHFDARNWEPGNMISVFSHSNESLGVSEPGLKYQLKNARLTNTVVQGVSNEFLPDTTSSIEVKHGTLVITFPSETAQPRIIHYHTFEENIGKLNTSISSVLSAL